MVVNFAASFQIDVSCPLAEVILLSRTEYIQIALLFISDLNTPNNVHQSANNQDALLAQMFAAQRAMAMQNVGFNDQNTSVVAMQMEKARAESTLQKVGKCSLSSLSIH